MSATEKRKLKIFCGIRNFNWEKQHLIGSLEEDGHEVVWFDPATMGREMDQYNPRFNKDRFGDELLKMFKEHLPYDMALTYLSPPNTNAGIPTEMRKHCPVVNFGANNSMSFYRANSGLCTEFDWNWTTDSFSIPLFELEGAKAFYLPMASRRSIYGDVKPYDKKPFDVSFVGSVNHYREVMLTLLKRSKGIKVFSASDVDEAQMFHIARSSKIVLGMKSVQLSAREWVRLRDFEVPMLGSFLLSEYSDDINDVYRVGMEIDVYKNFDIEHLAYKCLYWLKYEKEREEVARKGHLRAITDHTWTKRFNAIFDFVLDGKSDGILKIGRTTSVDSPVRLNIGCGPTYVRDWTNIDVGKNCVLVSSDKGQKILESHVVDYISQYYALKHAADSRGKGEFLSWATENVVDEIQDVSVMERPQGSVDEIVMFHCLEHFSYSESQRVLVKILSWLKSGGSLYLGFPNIGLAYRILDLYGSIFSGGDDDNDQDLLKSLAYGSQIDEFSFHKSGWLELDIIRHLRSIGFTEVRKLPNLANNMSYFLQAIKA